MSIPFRCPSCGRFTEVELRYAGQTGQCGNCQKPITIPTPEEAARRHDSTDPERDRSQQQPTLISANPQTIAGRRKSRSPLFIYGAAAMLLAAGLLWLILASANRKTRPAVIAKGAPASCEKNLKRIGKALQAYYDEHGHFPASTFRDQPTDPLHSWRVELLPLLEETKLFESLRLDEEWNSESNRRLERARPLVFAAIDDKTLADFETSYLAIIGNDAAMTRTVGRSKEEFTDGLDQTILLVECRGLATSWLEPTDLDTMTLEWSINMRATGIGSHHHNGGAHVLMANGDVRWLDESTPPEVLRALCTINGGEKIDLDRWLKQ